MNALILCAFGIEPWLPAAILTLVATNLGMALPSAPGYLGVYHFLSMLALSAFNIESSTAFSYAVVAHLLVFGSFAVSGAVALVLDGTNLFALYRRSVERKPS